MSLSHEFNEDSALFGFDLIKQEVADAYPEYTPDQARYTAIVWFNLRFSENIGRSLEEQKNVPDQETLWEAKVIDGVEHLTIAKGEYKGRTLDSFWENTRKFAEHTHNPLAYDSREHEVQLAMQQSIISGEAGGAAMLLSHPDDTKYVQVWRKTDDGKFISENIDFIHTAGRHLTHQEANIFMNTLYERHSDKRDQGKDSAYIHVIKKDAPFDRSEVEEIVQNIMETSKHKPVMSKEPVHADAPLFQNEPHEAVKIFIHDVLTTPHQQDKEKFSHAEDREKTMMVCLEVGESKQDQVKLKDKLKEKPLRTQLVQEYTSRIKDFIALYFVKETSIGIVAIPFLLERLAKPLPKSLQAVEKSIKRQERKQMKKKRKEERERKLVAISLLLVDQKDQRIKKNVRGKKLWVEGKLQRSIKEKRVKRKESLVRRSLNETRAVLRSLDKPKRREHNQGKIRLRSTREATAYALRKPEERRVRSQVKEKKSRKPNKNVLKRRLVSVSEPQIRKSLKGRRRQRNRVKARTIERIRKSITRRHESRIPEEKKIALRSRNKDRRASKSLKRHLARLRLALQKETTLATRVGEVVEMPVQQFEYRKRPAYKNRERLSLKKKEKRAIVEFSFAFTLFMYMNIYEKAKEKLTGRFQPAANSRIEIHPITDKPWILLAIVYQMTAIREQGMQQATSNRQPFGLAQGGQATGNGNQKTKKRKIKKKVSGRVGEFPERGVIFAASS